MCSAVLFYNFFFKKVARSYLTNGRQNVISFILLGTWFDCTVFIFLVVLERMQCSSYVCLINPCCVRGRSSQMCDCRPLALLMLKRRVPIKQSNYRIYTWRVKYFSGRRSYLRYQLHSPTAKKTILALSKAHCTVLLNIHNQRVRTLENFTWGNEKKRKEKRRLCVPSLASSANPDNNFFESFLSG